MELIFLLLSILPQPSGCIDVECSYVEVNHFYDNDGKKVFSQLILWNDGQFGPQVIDYKMLSRGRFSNEDDFKIVDYTDRNPLLIVEHSSLIFRVRCGSIQETWTQFDPELVNREVYPKLDRQTIFK